MTRSQIAHHRLPWAQHAPYPPTLFTPPRSRFALNASMLIQTIKSHMQHFQPVFLPAPLWLQRAQVIHVCVLLWSAVTHFGGLMSQRAAETDACLLLPNGTVRLVQHRKHSASFRALIARNHVRRMPDTAGTCRCTDVSIRHFAAPRFFLSDMRCFYQF